MCRNDRLFIPKTGIIGWLLPLRYQGVSMPRNGGERLLRNKGVTFIRYIQKTYILVDNDDGFKDFKNSLELGKEIKKTSSGFKKYEFPNSVYLILFPDNYAVEELFKEHDEILESCANQIFNSDFTKAASDKSIPANFTRAHANIRNKTVNGLNEAKKAIRNSQDVKDYFWGQVEEKNLHINKEIAKEIRSLIS